MADATSSPGKRVIDWQPRSAPGTQQRSRQKQDPSGKRTASFGQWENRELPGPFMYVTLDGTAYPLGFGNKFLAEKGLKLAQNPDSKTRKQYFEISKSSKHGCHVAQMRTSKHAAELVFPAIKERCTGMSPSAVPFAPVLPPGGGCIVLCRASHLCLAQIWTSSLTCPTRSSSIPSARSCTTSRTIALLSLMHRSSFTRSATSFTREWSLPGWSLLPGQARRQDMCSKSLSGTWANSCLASLTCLSGSAWNVPHSAQRNRNLGWASASAPVPAQMKKRQSMRIGCMLGIWSMLNCLLPCHGSMILSSVFSPSQLTHGFSVPCMPTCHRLGLVSCLVIGLEFKSCSKFFIDRV